MAPRIGFSTGALAYGDFEIGVRLLRERGVLAVELSALRDKELPPLVAALDGLLACRLPISPISRFTLRAASRL